MAWNSETIDNVLSLGDSMYLNALQNRLIPIDNYQGTLSVTNLPNIVRFPNNLIAHSLATNNWSIDNNNLPIVVEPIEAENNNLPIVVEPIAAENNQLPIVVEPIEAQSDKSKSQIWFINYGKELQGLLRNEHELLGLRSALR